MTIQDDVRGLDPLQLVTLFVIDGTAQGVSQVLRFTPGETNEAPPILWQGEAYYPLPIQAEGFEMNASGSLPRPTFTMSNIGGVIGEFMLEQGGMLGATITRKRTLAKYLDGQPQADPNAHMPDDVWILRRKQTEDPIQIVYESATIFDLENVMLPGRQIIAGTCQYIYRGEDCGYTGPPVQDFNGNPTTDPALDRCRKTLDACKARFGTKGPLPTSAFPASLLIQNQ